MSAAVLREAARLMRNRAMAADDGPWKWAEQTHDEWVGIQSHFAALGSFANANNAFHVAAMHPGVVLAVAKAMDDVAQAWEIAHGWATDLDDDPIRFEDTTDGGWLAVARAYLGKQVSA